MTEATKADSTTRTVERALALLSVVCQQGAVTQSEAAKAAGLSTSTALRLLRTLEGADFVRREETGTYRPGPAIVQLGVLALSQESLISTYRAAMDRIVAQTGESTYLSIPADGGHGLYIAIAEGTQSVRHVNWVGRRFVLEGSAAGMALQAQTGLNGCAVVSDGVEPDITAVAIPLVAGGKAVASMSVVVPSYRMSAERIGQICQVLTAETGSVHASG